MAGFTVWGRRENSALVTLISEAFTYAGVQLPQKKHDNFELGADKEKLVEEAKKAGFKKATAYYDTLR